MFFAVLIVGLVVAVSMLQTQPAAPKPTKDDIEAPTAEEGKPIPVVFGTVCIKSSNCVWWGDVKLKAIKAKGGKK